MISRIGVQPVIVSVGPGEARQTYRVGEVTADGEDVSVEVSCTNDLSVDGNVNLVHWRGDAGPYRVYRSNGTGFVLLEETIESCLIDVGDA
ncbi:hypothetical protein [Sphingobium baderi]|uniref:Uncharacterized protein n=1 Tax=Sphingobium baderi LL03 TaxID=1114964 RepID=T0I9E8_9SPHN|nr:hypothetical protein [Sphingobium baderi]EQB06229.1 hypothetical protein L485_00985 [Sphingobium baderi LL03]KMS62736.1 hypothetical protein V475_06465 [Sphingobium baderi LL03]